MKFYRITACDFSKDLSGEGANLYGGRWNSKGTRLLYTAESAALAMLEALAHITMVSQKRSFCKMMISPADPEFFNGLFGKWKWFYEIENAQLPTNWRSSPGPDVLKEIGDEFVKKVEFLALKVPSVLEPDSFNYLLNPAHPAFSNLKVFYSESVSFDQRLVMGKDLLLNQ